MTISLWKQTGANRRRQTQISHISFEQRTLSQFSFIFHHRSQFSLFLSEVRATFKSVSYTHTTVKTSPPLRRKDPFSPTQLRSVHARKCHSHTRNILLFPLLSFFFFYYSHWTPLLLDPLAIYAVPRYI